MTLSSILAAKVPWALPRGDAVTAATSADQSEKCLRLFPWSARLHGAVLPNYFLHPVAAKTVSFTAIHRQHCGAPMETGDARGCCRGHHFSRLCCHTMSHPSTSASSNTSLYRMLPAVILRTGWKRCRSIRTRPRAWSTTSCMVIPAR